ncbi:sigma-70 family RNA polymerase sigma factor [Candidatus Poribacteria bacterium]|nr:sigma-70 family RNA polymerase sigma factor [Candidatus Poribacteria bacterium]
MPASDEALMCQIQKGDMKSFDLLVKRWEKPLLNHCYRLVDNIELSEDLRQEVFLRVYRSAKTYKPIAKFSTWIYRIATNLCLDTLAKRRRRKAISIDSESQDFGEGFIDPSRNPDEMVVNTEIESQVRLALSRLPEDLRIIVVMRHYDGLKFREIAEILRCPVSTVKSRMVSGMQRLSQMLSKQEWI